MAQFLRELYRRHFVAQEVSQLSSYSAVRNGTFSAEGWRGFHAAKTGRPGDFGKRKSIFQMYVKLKKTKRGGDDQILLILVFIENENAKLNSRKKEGRLKKRLSKHAAC